MGDGGSELVPVVESRLGAAAASSSGEPEREERSLIIRFDDLETSNSCYFLQLNRKIFRALTH